MRVFDAGARWVIAVRLVPLLVEAGHEVAGDDAVAGEAGTGSIYREESKDMAATIRAGKLDEKRGAAN